MVDGNQMPAAVTVRCPACGYAAVHGGNRREAYEVACAELDAWHRERPCTPR